jgi:hypothetical protein
MRSLRRTTEEIIAEIVADLHPHRCTEARVKAEVRREIARLFAFVQAHNDASALRTAILATNADDVAAMLGRNSPVVKDWETNLTSVQAYVDRMWRDTPTPQRACAVIAYGLMLRLSKKSPTGYRAGPFHSIASLLFEIAGGMRDVSQKRACDIVLREARQNSG